MTPEYAGRLCDDLDKRLRGSEMNLGGLADMVRVVLREEAWRERRIRTGQVVKHERFIDFLKTPPLEGLGEEPDRVKKLLRDDLDALAAFEAAVVGPKHIHKAADSSNITIKNQAVERGTARAYTLRRLAKDHPVLFDQVTAGTLSANAAAIKAGFRKKPTAFDQVIHLLRKMPRKERARVKAWIEEATA